VSILQAVRQDNMSSTYCSIERFSFPHCFCKDSVAHPTHIGLKVGNFSEDTAAGT